MTEEQSNSGNQITIPKYSPLYVVIGVGGAVWTYWHFSTSIPDSIEFLLSCIIATAALFAAYYAGAAFRSSRHALNNALEISTQFQQFQKKRISFDIVQSLNNISSAEIRHFLEEHGEKGKNHYDPKQFETVKNDKEIAPKVRQMLGTFEDAAIAIQSGIACEAFLKESIASMVEFYYSGFRGYIEGLRAHTGDKKYYKNLEELRNKWNSNGN